MTAAITLGVVAVAVLGLIVYLVRGDVAVDQSTDARVAQVATEVELERVAFELEVTRKALTRATATISALEGLPDDDPANADLDPGDVDSRVRRLAARWAAEDARGSVPADPADSLPASPAAEPT